MSNQINIDEEIEALPQERHLIVAQRSLSRYGVMFELNPNGGITIIDDDVYDLEECLDTQEFLHIMKDEYKRMIIQDSLDRLIKEGLIETAGVDENGEIRYRATEA